MWIHVIIVSTPSLAFLPCFVEATRLGRQELNAEILEDVDGALWTRDLLEQTRKSKDEKPPLQRIVVATDPAVSVTENSDCAALSHPSTALAGQ